MNINIGVKCTVIIATSVILGIVSVKSVELLLADNGTCVICGDEIKQYCNCGCLDKTIDEEGYVVQFNEDNTKILGNVHVFCLRQKEKIIVD